MRKLLVLFVFVLTNLNLFSQPNVVEKEQEIKAKFENLVQAKMDSLKLSICKEIEKLFTDVLTDEMSFDYSFSELSKMGKLTSTDQKFRIFNWNCVLSDGTYRYFGLLQIKQKDTIQLEVLTDSAVATDMFHQYKTEDWPGGLYYQIIPFKRKGTSSYLLLGWDGNNFQTNKKVIEVLTIDDNGNISFGAPVIFWKGKMLNRVVFEYAKQARMTIQYNEKEEQIIFDHLAPSLPKYQNQFEYYGPDFSYDALEYQKGKWVLIENIDVRNMRVKK
ncbi:hypothetical protein BZG02_09750 [Labilibaculum filiforme]|uniref:Uncharacterized protein n=1 Tax=Labilibaculum filiforme TaxID=1940526 RepID=A0A2N3HY93_9BACT|nr:hypothetical protein [Labilibaculum filiforme]PKQ63046.1 hypothetical protein BZG02_09750 [Labilibaculum filiforme]